MSPYPRSLFMVLCYCHPTLSSGAGPTFFGTRNLLCIAIFVLRPSHRSPIRCWIACTCTLVRPAAHISKTDFFSASSPAKFYKMGLLRRLSWAKSMMPFAEPFFHPKSRSPPHSTNVCIPVHRQRSSVPLFLSCRPYSVSSSRFARLSLQPQPHFLAIPSAA